MSLPMQFRAIGLWKWILLGMFFSFAVSTYTIVNEEGSFTSLQLDDHGFPVISYFQPSDGALWLARCRDKSCSLSVKAFVDGNTSVAAGYYSSLALTATGEYPVISYVEVDEPKRLKLAHCNNLWCNDTMKAIAVVDQSGRSFGHTSLALLNDNPIIAYYDSDEMQLMLAFCQTPQCKAFAHVVLDDGNITDDVGFYLQMVLRAEAPVIAYSDRTKNRLKLVMCETFNCTDFISMDASTYGGQDVSLQISDSKMPVIAFVDSTGELYILECHDEACTISSVTPMPLVSSGSYISLQLADGNPRVSFYDNNSSLVFLSCVDSNCSDPGWFVATVVGNTTENAGAYSSLQLDAGNQPVISYHHTSKQFLGLVRCETSTCLATDSPTMQPTSEATETTVSPSAAGGPITPTRNPTFSPTAPPSPSLPTASPSQPPTLAMLSPTASPTLGSPSSTFPTASPSSPTSAPSSALPTANPTPVMLSPTASPTLASPSSTFPTASPSSPTSAPSSAFPTASPSQNPTPVMLSPTASPTLASPSSTFPTASPSSPTSAPSSAFPTVIPSSSPEAVPSRSPTSFPSKSPSLVPSTIVPTQLPSKSPSLGPSSRAPSVSPTGAPTSTPTIVVPPPSRPPTVPSTQNPSSLVPTGSPTVSALPPVIPQQGLTIVGNVVLADSIDLSQGSLQVNGSFTLASSSVVTVTASSAFAVTGDVVLAGDLVITLDSLEPTIVAVVNASNIVGQFSSINVTFVGGLLKSCDVVNSIPSGTSFFSVAVSVDSGACGLSPGVLAGIVVGCIVLVVVFVVLGVVLARRRVALITARMNKSLKAVELNDMQEEMKKFKSK